MNLTKMSKRLMEERYILGGAENLLSFPTPKKVISYILAKIMLKDFNIH